MKSVDVCRGCGKEYHKKYPNQRYCSQECLVEARKIQSWKSRHKARMDASAPNITINDMVKAMIRLSKERGYTVQYGELQTDLITGRVKIRGGKII